MFSYYSFNHRFKRSMLEITSKTSYDILWKYLDPLQKEKLPENIVLQSLQAKKLMTLSACMKVENISFRKGLFTYYLSL